MVEWFQSEMGVYSSKELDKILVKVGSISGMQVAEYIAAMKDEGEIRCEKIGSGNWYWSFPSELKMNKQKVLDDLKAVEGKLLAEIAESERVLGEETALRAREDGVVDGEGRDREALMELRAALTKRDRELKLELAKYSEQDPTEMLAKMEQTRVLKIAAEKWTDRLESLESYLRKFIGDREQVAMMMQYVYWIPSRCSFACSLLLTPFLQTTVRRRICLGRGSTGASNGVKFSTGHNCLHLHGF